MAEALRDQFGPAIPVRLAETIQSVFPSFHSEAFLKDALNGYDSLALLPRGQHLASALRKHLPDCYEHSIQILLRSLGPKLECTQGNGMSPFFYLPHTYFVSQFGLGHFEHSMAALYELTQRFTAEFSIRPFLEHHQERTLSQLKSWATDPSEHVRRLVSEGTRPRLPWAQRLRAFQLNPQLTLPLLEQLKDDPDLYVRRSVANHLNDIGKDHPTLLLEITKRWGRDATPHRQWVIRHALRSLVKKADRATLDALGFQDKKTAKLSNLTIAPSSAKIGGSIVVSFTLSNAGPVNANFLVDFRIHFVKANGSTKPKVFKLKELPLAAGQTVVLSKKVSLAPMSTRRHYPGTHSVEIQVNGTLFSAGSFELGS